MKNRIAVMDLGTNTFHLLIAEGTLSEPIIKHATIAVKLGEGGINDGIIRPEAYQRGIDAMQHFETLIQEFKPVAVKAVATSALRNAVNSINFIEQVKVRTGISIEIIDGDTEAGYIYKGIKASGCLKEASNLIVDIGGGSVELIWCNANQIFWKRSFEIGAARLMAAYHQQDPIVPEQVEALHEYLEEQLAPLFTQLKQQQIDTLIGSSGAFETFTELIEAEQGTAINWQKQINYTFNIDQLLQLFSWLHKSSHHERAAISVIPVVRVDMIVVASVLTGFLMQKFKLRSVCMSAYSLKEGVMTEILSKNN